MIHDQTYVILVLNNFFTNKERIVKQLVFSFLKEQINELQIPLDDKIQKELLARMAILIIAVKKRGGIKNEDK